MQAYYVKHLYTMNAVRNCCLILLVLIALQACKTNTAGDGSDFNEKKYWRQRSAKLKDAFYYNYWPNARVYPKNTQAVTTDTVKGSTAIICDTFKLYLFDEAVNFKSIFTSGLISPKDIYCGIGQSCTEHDDGWRFDDGSKAHKDEVHGLSGVSSTIDYFKEIEYNPKRIHKRRFVFYVPANWNTGFAVYLIELTNKKANTKTDLETFIKGATLTYYQFAWGEI
jgi:hypothetical protein